MRRGFHIHNKTVRVFDQFIVGNLTDFGKKVKIFFFDYAKTFS